MFSRKSVDKEFTKMFQKKKRREEKITKMFHKVKIK